MTVSESPSDTDIFLFERAETEHDVAERKRDATVTKATAIATLSSALIAILAGPAFDLAGLDDRSTRWLLLCTILALLVSIGFAAAALSVAVVPGDRPSRIELDNWTTRGFQNSNVRNHARDFARMYVEATNNVRDANERSQARLSLSVWAVGIGLVFLLITFLVEIA